MDTLLVYLDAIGRLESLVGSLASPELSHCKISLERATSALSEARSKLQGAFHDWLAESSRLSLLEMQQAAEDETSSELIVASVDQETITALGTVCSFNVGNPHAFSDLVVTWVEIRSNFLASACEPFFGAAQSGGSGKLLPKAYKIARKILEVIA